MPNTFVIKHAAHQAGIPDAAQPCETRPLIIKELNSVKPSTTPRATRHWLRRLFTSPAKPALPEKIALTDVLAQSANQSQEPEGSPARRWLKAGVAITLFSAAGALAWQFSRRPQNALAEIDTSGNITGLLPAELAFPLAGYSDTGLAIRAAANPQDHTALLEATRDNLLARFPGIRGVATQQLLVEPLLKMLLASVGQHEVNDVVLEQQLTTLVNVMLSTLTIPEQLQLYRRERTPEDNAPLATRFTAHAGLGYVPLYQLEYRLRTKPEGVPFITDKEGNCHFIRFNQRTLRWEYVDEADNQGYSAQARDFNERYRLRLIELPDKVSIDYYSEYDYAGINSTGWIHTRGLFIGGNFIPVWSLNNEPGETYANRGNAVGGQRRLLVRGDFGWEFERPSVGMDAYLKYLLESKNHGEENDYYKSIGAIRKADGLCGDAAGNAWLKKDNHYFRAESQYDAGTNGYNITLPDYPAAQVAYHNGVMQLKRAAEIPFALSTTTANNNVIGSGPFLIETAALDYLRQNAVVSTAKPVDVLRTYHRGLAEADDYSTLLVVNDRQYAVREYTDGYIRVENRNNPRNRHQDIVLWSAGDTLLLVRNGLPETHYTEVPTLGLTGAMDETDALPVDIETDLYLELKKYIDNDKAITLATNSNKLIKINKFSLPVTWYDPQTRQIYFVYNGKYFPVSFTDASNKDNPTGLNIINLFTREDFFSRNKLISSLVIEKKSDCIELKTHSALVAEKLQVSKDIAALYCQQKPWSRFTDMRVVEEAVNKVLATGKFFIAQPGITSVKGDIVWDNVPQRKQIKDNLYPPWVSETELEAINLSGPRNLLHPTRLNTQDVINNTFHLIKEIMIPSLLQATYYATPQWETLQTYLNQFLNDGNEELRSGMSVVWRARLQIINAWLRADNVYLLGGEQVYLSQQEKQSGKRVLISPASGKIYINTHKIDPTDKAQLRLIAELFSAAANIEGAKSAFSNLLQSNGMYLPVWDACQTVVDTLKQQKLTAAQQQDLLALSERYLEGVPAYQQQRDTLLTPVKLAYLAKNDPAYRAHLFFHSPELISLLSLDSFYLLTTRESSFADAGEWIKQYGALRAADRAMPTERSASTTAATVELPHPIHLPDPSPPRRGGAANANNAKLKPETSAHNASTLALKKYSTTPAPALHKTGAKFFVNPPGLDKNRGDRFVPDSHDDVFVPVTNIRPGNSTLQPEERVYVPGHGQVLVVEIPELACLGEKELTVAQELRFIGQALQSVFTANALAWQEITHIDIRGGVCPSEEDVRWMQDRASVFDAISDTILMIPPLSMVYAFKTVVGPGLIMAADDLEGKEISIADRIYYFLNAALQVLSLFHIEVPTLNGAQRAPLFFKGVNKVEDIKSGISLFEKRFSYIRDNEIYVNVEGKEYPLQISHDEESIIQNAQGRNELINFNQQEERWFLEDEIPTHIREERLRNYNKFKTSLAELSYNVVIESGEHDTFTIQADEKPAVTGVFSKMEFIPARLETVGDEVVAYTTLDTVPQEGQRLLFRGKYGWDFEQKSVNMDKYLEILLSRNNDVGSDFSNNVFGTIQISDGLSADPFGSTYIKKDYKYYHAEKIRTQDDTIIMKLPDFPGGVVKYKNGYFTLEGGTDIIFPAKTELIREKETTFRIEANALQYLHSNALTTTANYPGRVGTGIYLNEERTNTAFIANNVQFPVSFYTAREMHITRDVVYGGGPDIKFWLDKNTWYRVREETQETPIEYERIAACRVARSPGGGSSCAGMNIMIESGLNKKLIQEVSEGMAFDSVPPRDKLIATRENDIPFLYQDKESNKYYFKYSDAYFNAKIVETVDTGENPTGFPCLKVTGRSDFYRAEKNIALIVMYDDGEAIKMVDLTTFIVEKLKVSPDEAIIYNKKTIFNDMEYIDVLEKITNEIQLSEKIYVENPRDIVSPGDIPLSDSALDEAAKKALFPDEILKNNQYSVRIFGLTPPIDLTSAYIQDAIRYVKRNIDYLRQTILPHVMNSLNISHYNHPITEDYFMEIFKQSSPEFIKDIELSFFLRLVSAKDQINYRKIKLMTAVDVVNSDQPAYIKSPRSAVFIQGNEYLYINIDALRSVENAQFTATHGLTGDMLSAAFRASGKSAHIFDIPKNDGIFINIKDAYRSIQYTVRTSTARAGTTPHLRDAIARYLNKTPIYQPHIAKLKDISTDWRKFSYMLRFDPGLRAHLTLSSDDLLALVTLDIHFLIASTEQEFSMLHPWAKNYGKHRGIIQPPPEPIQLTDLMTSPTLDIKNLTPFSATETITDELPGNKGIYKTSENKLLLKWQNNYYPVEFFGPSGRLISVGVMSEIRQAYYYDPGNGALNPVQQLFIRRNVLTYDSEMNLYINTCPASDFSEISNFDKINNRLTPIGATRITRLPGRVTRIEYPWFNIYHPAGASHDIYLQGYGKVLTTKSTVPEGIKIIYYTHKGGQLLPYKGSTEDLLKDRLTERETIIPGNKVEDYMISPFNKEDDSHYYFSRKYNKNTLQIRSNKVSSAVIIEAVSKLFFDSEINIHLYIGRTTEGQRALPTIPGKSSPYLNRHARQSSSPSARWAFDQQIQGSTVQPDRPLNGFIPLREIPVFLHYDTIDIMAKQCIEHFLLNNPYDIYYGLSVNNEASAEIPSYIKDVRVQTTNNIRKAQRSLDVAWMKLNDPSYKRAIDGYLSFAFDLDNEAIIRQISGRLKDNISRVRNFLIDAFQSDYENIAIVSTRQVADPKLPGVFHSAISHSLFLDNMPSAFIFPGDAYRRIFIMGDSYPRMEANRKVFEHNEQMQTHVLIHEASHITANTYDIAYIDTEERDYTDEGLNIRQAQKGLKKIDEQLNSGSIKHTAIWKDFMPNYCRYLGIKEPPTEAEFIKTIQENALLKANLIMTNADSFAVFVKHLANINTGGRYKREAAETVTESDYKHLGLLFAAARDHYINSLE